MKRLLYKGEVMTIKELWALPECTAETPRTLATRILRMPLDDAMTLNAVHRFEYKGQYLTREQIADLPECKLSVHSLIKKLRVMSVYDALKSVIVVEYNGCYYTPVELSRLPECRFTTTAVRKRLKRLGMDPYRAMGIPVPVKEIEIDEFIGDDKIDIDEAVKEFLEPPRIIPEDDKIKVTIKPPAPHTTSHYWIMKSVADRRQNDTVNFKEFTK